MPFLPSLAIVAMLAGMTTYEAIVQYGQERGSDRDWQCLLKPPWLKLSASGRRCLAVNSSTYGSASSRAMASGSLG
ncbi:MAG: hypothetical protein ACXVBO_22280 [Isosphaeraceae bacterium]